MGKLKMIEPPNPDETLNTTIARSAEFWAEADLLTIIAGLREQRARWNLEQSRSSRKRVPSSKIKAPKSEIQQLAAGLKKITL